MPMVWGGSTWAPSAWKPFYEKTLQQNLMEASYLAQTAGLAIAYAAPVSLPSKGAALGTAAAVTTVAGLAVTGLKVGGVVYGLDWLQENWWIPALLLGGYIVLKSKK